MMLFPPSPAAMSGRRDGAKAGALRPWTYQEVTEADFFGRILFRGATGRPAFRAGRVQGAPDATA